MVSAGAGGVRQLKSFSARFCCLFSLSWMCQNCNFQFILRSVTLLVHLAENAVSWVTLNLKVRYGFTNFMWNHVTMKNVRSDRVHSVLPHSFSLCQTLHRLCFLLRCLCIVLGLQSLGSLKLRRIRQSTQCACSFRLCQTFHRLCVNSEPFAAMQLQTANAKFNFLFNSLCNSFDNLGFYLELQQKLKCLPSCLQNLYFYCVKYQSIWDTVKFVTVWCYLKIVQKYFKMAQFRAMFSMEFLCQVQGSSTKSEFSVPILILFCWLPKFATFGGKNVCNSEVRRPWCNLV